MIALRHFLCAALLLLLPAIADAQPPTTEWVKTVGTPGNESAGKICSDPYGYSYHAGSYWDTLRLCNDSLPRVRQTMSSNMIQNIFITKLDSAGNCVWAKAGVNIVPLVSGGAIACEIMDMRYHEGYVYCAGVFTDSIVFDSLVLHNPVCVSYCHSTFVLKLDSAGTIVWGKTFLGNSFNIWATTIIPHANGVIVGGHYVGELLVDTFQLNAPNSWNYSAYLLGLDHAGNCRWATNVGAGLMTEVEDITYDGGNALYLAGIYMDSIIFPNVTLQASQLFGSFFARYDTLGNFAWAKGGAGVLEGMFYNHCLSMNNPAHFYFTATFADSARFGSSTYTTPSGSWYRDALLKVDSSGQFLWSGVTGNKAGLQSFGADLEANNAGFLLYTGLMDTLTVGNNFFTSTAGSLDMLLIQFNPGGNVSWAKHYGGQFQEIALDAHLGGNTIYTSFRGMSTFPFDQFTVQNLGGGDAVFAKMKADFSPDGISEMLAGDAAFALYPNPSSGECTIVSEKPIAHLRITDTRGRLVSEEKPQAQRTILRLEEAGMYFITITSEGRTGVKKLIVTR